MRKQLKNLAAIAVVLLAPLAAQAAIRTEVVEYKLDDQRFVGYLAYDDSIRKPVPGVLVIHEWWGLNDYARQRARDVAAMGYVAFAADMYGDGKSTADPKQAGERASQVRGTPLMPDRARAALKVLSKDKRVDDDHLAAIGFCFGGGGVLELAFSGARLDGVVSLHGYLPVPTVRQARRTRAAVLVLQGAEDPFVKPEEMDAFHKAMTEGKADWQFVQYGGAVHDYSNPAADALGMPGVAYDERTEHRAWQAMRDFLHERFSNR